MLIRVTNVTNFLSFRSISRRRENDRSQIIIPAKNEDKRQFFFFCFCSPLHFCIDPDGALTFSRISRLEFRFAGFFLVR